MGMLEDYISALQKVPMNEAIPGGAGTTPEGDPTMLSNIITNTATLPKRAIEASERDLTHLGDTSQDLETVGPAMDMARMMMTSGMPMAEKGAAGIFGGKLAVTADLKALQEAQQMEANAVHPEDIWQSTGWFKHPADNQWRFEIPDNKSALRYQAGNPRSLDKTVVRGPVTEMMQHPELYKAYPELRHIQAESRFDPASGTGEGSFDPNQGHIGSIDINAPDLYTGRSVGLHELQHAVQNIEGFHPGINPEFFSKLQKKYPQHENLGDALPMDLYKRTAGEVEARNVQMRKDFEPSRRKLEHPLVTSHMDTPLDQVLSFTGTDVKPIDPILLDILRKK